MKPADAAADWWATIDAVTAHRPIATRHERASKALKAHMKEHGLTTFRGIRRDVGSGGLRLDHDLLQKKFGAAIDDCKSESERVSLVPVKRPRSVSAPADT